MVVFRRVTALKLDTTWRLTGRQLEKIGYQMMIRKVVCWWGRQGISLQRTLWKIREEACITLLLSPGKRARLRTLCERLQDGQEVGCSVSLVTEFFPPKSCLWTFCWMIVILLATHRDYRCVVKTFLWLLWEPKAFGSGGSNLQWINDSRELRVEVLSCVTSFSFKYLSSCSLSGWSKLFTMLTSKLEKLSQYGQPTMGINIRFSATRSQVFKCQNMSTSGDTGWH